MGRFKSVEIKDLFFEDFYKIFDSALVDFAKESTLTEGEIVKKIEPKIKDLLKNYEETSIDLYVKNHKFKINEYLKSHFRNQRKIVIHNKKSFIYFNLYLNGCSILYEKIIERIPRKRIDQTLK